MEWLLLAISVGLVLACGVFGAAEYSFVAVDRAAVEKAAAAGDRQAQGVRTALRSLSTQLSGAQVGVTLTNLVIGFLAEPAIAALLGRPLTALGVPESRGARDLGDAGPGAGHHRHDDLRRAGAQEARHRGAAADRPAHPGADAGLHHRDDLADPAAQRLGQRASCGRWASSRRRSCAPPAPPTSWPRWPTAPPSRAPWTPRPPTWCSARSPSARARPAEIMTPRVQMACVDATDPVSEIIDLSSSTGLLQVPGDQGLLGQRGGLGPRQAGRGGARAPSAPTPWSAR